MPALRYLTIFLASTFICSVSIEAKPKARAKKKTQSARKKALTPEEQLKTFVLPDGFVIELVASEKNGLINPIDLAFDDAGRLWTQTAEMYPLDPVPSKVGRNALEKVDLKAKGFEEVRGYYQLKKRGTDKILIIQDPTKQVTGKIPAFAEGLAIPQSILPYKTGVFVAHGSEMLYLDDTDGDGSFDKHTTVLGNFGFFDTHTMSHTLVRGPGGWVHFSHGALNKGKVKVTKTGEGIDVKYSKIARFSLDGEKMEIQNCGLNNIWGFHLKENGQWYGTEANDIFWSLTPLHPMMTYKGIGNDKFRDYQPVPESFHKFKVGGTGISGLTYDENGAKGFPAQWKGVGFLANPITNTINCVVADRNPDGSVISKHLADFLTCSDDWFRPVNIEFGPDGCLYIVDWYNKIVSHNEVARTHPDRDKTHGRIWRIRHKSQKPSSITNLTKIPTSELPKYLAGDILWEKRAAWHQIADRQATELVPVLNKLVLDKSQKLPTRIVALWSLESLKAYNQETLLALSKDQNPDIRREAVRSLASFNPGVESVVSIVKPLISDTHYMVKEQVLRTLAEINQANQDSIALLVSACGPKPNNNKWGDGYKKNFQRFLARKALEQYPSELSNFMDSTRAKEFNSAQLDWAAQALAGDKRTEIFVQNWKKNGGKLDEDTLISIAGHLHRPEIMKLITPKLATKEFVELALKVQPRVKSSNLLKAIAPGLKKLISSPAVEDQSLAIQAAISFQSPAISKELIAKAISLGATEVTSQLVDAIAIDPKSSQAMLRALATNNEVSRGIRLNAMVKLFALSPKEAAVIAVQLAKSLSDSEKTTTIRTLAESSYGAEIVLGLVQNKVFDVNLIDLSAGEKILWSAPRRHKMIAPLRKSLAQKRTASTAKTEEKFKNYQKALTSLKGNTEAGKALFGSCLACHQVGDQGYDIAPALDGSANRDVDHLLTAIVKPDEAVESSYRIYRVTHTNGDIFEGYMYQNNDYGVTLAFMGAGKKFIPKEHIKIERFLPGSFMPSHFGGLPEQTMVDLISYIRTLK